MMQTASSSSGMIATTAMTQRLQRFPHELCAHKFRNLRDRVHVHSLNVCAKLVMSAAVFFSEFPGMIRAVQQNGFALQRLPAELRTPQLCFAAVQQKQQRGSALRYVPAELMTPQLCLIAVQQNGSALRFVPAELMKVMVACVRCQRACRWPDSRKQQAIHFALVHVSSLEVATKLAPSMVA